MSTVRRVLLAFYSLLLMGAAIGLDILAWNTSKKLDINTGSFQLQAFVTATDTAKWGFTALMAAVVLIGFVTLLMALVDPSASWSRGSFRVRRPDGARVELPLQHVERALRQEIERLPGVLSATPRIRYNEGAIESYVSALVEPLVSVPHVTNAISNTTIAAIREQVGEGAIHPPVVSVETARAASTAGGTAAPSPERRADD